MVAISAATARICVRRVRELTGSKLPVDVRSIACQMGVEILEPADILVDGYVGSTPDGRRVIRYRRSNPYLRNRFTIAHEICHLLIAEVSGTPLSSRKSRKGFDDEEVLANRLAAEMLMPESILRDELCQVVPCWGTLQKLRKLFDVSAHSLLRRTTEVSGVVAVFARRRSNHSPHVFYCDATVCPPVYFSEPFQSSIARAANSVRGPQFSVSATAADQNLEIPCELRIAATSAAGEDWAFGWTNF